MWYFKTRVGTFRITHDPYRPALYRLNMDEVFLGNYTSPEAAAEDVYMHATGWSKWDMLEHVRVPCDILEWSRGKPGF